MATKPAVLKIFALGCDQQRGSSDSSIAEYISAHLKQAFDTDYQVITYKGYSQEWYPDRTTYVKLPKHDVWCYIYKIDAGCADYDYGAVYSVLEKEFKWGTPTSCEAFGKAIKEKVNAQCSGCYRVHVVKDRTNYDCVGRVSTVFHKGPYTAYVHRW